MDSVYINGCDLNDWILEHLPSNRDWFSIDDLIGAIEDMDGEINSLKEKYQELEERFYEYKQDNPPRY